MHCGLLLSRARPDRPGGLGLRPSRSWHVRGGTTSIQLAGRARQPPSRPSGGSRVAPQIVCRVCLEFLFRGVVKSGVLGRPRSAEREVLDTPLAVGERGAHFRASFRAPPTPELQASCVSAEQAHQTFPEGPERALARARRRAHAGADCMSGASRRLRRARVPRLGRHEGGRSHRPSTIAAIAWGTRALWPDRRSVLAGCVGEAPGGGKKTTLAEPLGRPGVG